MVFVFYSIGDRPLVSRYAYDKGGNLNRRTNNALIQSFAVNDVNQLSSASESGTLTVAGTATEPGSDVTSVSVNGQSADVYQDGSFAAPGFAPVNGENTYTAIAQDHYPRFSTNSVTVNVLGGADYTYDSNGNLTSDGARNFAYDDENQLIGVWEANNWSNSFAYDGLMRKRIEQDFAWNGSGWTETNEVHYVYDGNLVVQERDRNNEPLTTYTRGVDLSGTLDGAGGIGGLLARSDNQKIVPAILAPQSPTPQNVVTSYYFSDDQGNITALVSPAGMLLAQYEYDPFGNLISKSGLMADINKYRFSSKEWDDNAGLYYYGFRFYDPNLQRWVNRDPIGENGGLDLYAYVLNSPVDLTDALGFSDTRRAGEDGDGLPPEKPLKPPVKRPAGSYPKLDPLENLESIEEAQTHDRAGIRGIARSQQEARAYLEGLARDAEKCPGQESPPAPTANTPAPIANTRAPKAAEPTPAANESAPPPPPEANLPAGAGEDGHIPITEDPFDLLGE